MIGKYAVKFAAILVLPVIQYTQQLGVAGRRQENETP